MTVPLVITRDSALRDDLGRLAAAAGVAPAFVRDPAAALGAWATASVVLVGADAATALDEIRPQRRDGTYVVVPGPASTALFEVALRLGAESVVGLPQSEAWLVERLTDAGDLRPARGTVIGVVGGAGGAGATTFACALGQVAARTGPALLVDADVLGPGIDRVLGTEDLAGVRWPSLMQTTGRLSARSLAEAVPRRAGLGVVSWRSGPRGSLPAFALREVLSAGRRGHECVVVDLPRAADAVLAEVTPRCTRIVVVVPATLVGLASAAQVAARLPGGAEAGALVRGEAFTPSEVAAAVGLPVLAMMPDQRGLAEALDLGTGPVRTRRSPLARAAAAVLASLAEEPAA
jgi:secretion/DNA translocation related CpaE-like protein